MGKRQLIEEYTARINCVIDYIDNNVGNEFTLDELAGVSGFSKYHFHRLFYFMVGETLFQFIQRIRLEKAASMLAYNPDKPITQIAIDCGFSSSSVFSRSFKECFGLAASEWRKKNDSNQCKIGSNSDKEYGGLSLYIDRGSKKYTWRGRPMQKNVSVRVEQLPEMTVAYVRHIGPYKGDEQLFEGLFNKLFAWAGAHGLLNPPETKTIVVYHDDPSITDGGKLRTSVSITVPDDTKVSGEIGKMQIQGGKYAMASFELANGEYEEAWSWVYGQWLPQSGYQPDDGPTFELYPEADHNDGKHRVDICIPVKPL